MRPTNADSLDFFVQTKPRMTELQATRSICKARCRYVMPCIITYEGTKIMVSINLLLGGLKSRSQIQCRPGVWGHNVKHKATA